MVRVAIIFFTLNLHPCSVDPDQPASRSCILVQYMAHCNVLNCMIWFNKIRNVSYMGHNARKSVFGVSEKSRFKPVSSITKTTYILEISL